jgi:hypothetical protein
LTGIEWKIDLKFVELNEENSEMLGKALSAKDNRIGFSILLSIENVILLSDVKNGNNFFIVQNKLFSF